MVMVLDICELCLCVVNGFNGLMWVMSRLTHSKSILNHLLDTVVILFKLSDIFCFS